MTRLRGKVAIVTGASSGLGEATALALAAEGAAVLIAARRADRLQAVADRIASAGGTVAVCEADVSNEDDVRRLVELAKSKFGRIDLLVNNAGVMHNAPVVGASTDDWRAMIEINVVGLMLVCHAVLPIMRAQGGGQIINISSVAALNANPGVSVYAATKAAVSTFSEAIRKEFHRDNIRVSVVEPGVIATDLPAGIADPDMKARFYEWMQTMTPLTPDDVAEVITFIATRPDHVGLNEVVIRPTLQER